MCQRTWSVKPEEGCELLNFILCEISCDSQSKIIPVEAIPHKVLNSWTDDDCDNDNFLYTTVHVIHKHKKKKKKNISRQKYMQGVFQNCEDSIWKFPWPFLLVNAWALKRELGDPQRAISGSILSTSEAISVATRLLGNVSNSEKDASNPIH